MTKTIALALIASLVACSANDGSDGSETPTERRDEASASPAPSTGEPKPCPAEEPVSSGPKRTPSPVEKCEGKYICIGVGEIRLHSDGVSCFFDDDAIVLHADGRVSDAKGQTGSWTGDSVFFQLQFSGLNKNCPTCDSTHCELMD